LNGDIEHDLDQMKKVSPLETRISQRSRRT